MMPQNYFHSKPIDPKRCRAVHLEDLDRLPMYIRNYIAELKTRCDPSGDVQMLAQLSEEVKALEIRVNELKEENAALKQRLNRRRKAA